MENITNIAKALVLAQKEMSNAKKDSNNPFFKSKYADLNSVREACMSALNAHGISVLQPTVQVEGKNFVKTMLLHESGESIECLTEVLFSKQNDPQAQGSGITYARRYGLQSLICIGAEDDDGNKAAEKPKNIKEGRIDTKVISVEQLKELNNLIASAGLTSEIFCKSLKIRECEYLLENEFEGVKARLVAKAMEVTAKKEGGKDANN